MSTNRIPQRRRRGRRQRLPAPVGVGADVAGARYLEGPQASLPSRSSQASLPSRSSQLLAHRDLKPGNVATSPQARVPAVDAGPCCSPNARGEHELRCRSRARGPLPIGLKLSGLNHGEVPFVEATYDADSLTADDMLRLLGLVPNDADPAVVLLGRLAFALRESDATPKRLDREGLHVTFRGRELLVQIRNAT